MVWRVIYTYVYEVTQRVLSSTVSTCCSCRAEVAGWKPLSDDASRAPDAQVQEADVSQSTMLTDLILGPNMGGPIIKGPYSGPLFWKAPKGAQ